MKDYERLLWTLYEYKEEKAWFNICQFTSGGMRSNWFQIIADAIKFISQNENKNLFLQLGLDKKNRGTGNRSKQKQIYAIAGFYGDIDIKNEQAHKKSRYLPATIDDALSLVYGHGYDPTLVVNSGHGIHPYWAFDEPYVFEDLADHDAIYSLSQRFSETLKWRASRNNWTVDSVYNFERLLRLPDTLNLKVKDKPIRSKIIRDGGPTYSGPGDFEPFVLEFDGLLAFAPDGTPIKDLSAPAPLVSQVRLRELANGLTLDPNATVDMDRYNLACEIDPRLLATWNENRTDFKDTSPSSYDMSLAHILVSCQWPDQEIANALIARSRERHPGRFKKKLSRDDYIPSCILKARNMHEHHHGTITAGGGETTGEALDEEESETEADCQAEVKERARKMIKAWIGIEVLRIEKIKTDRGTYEITIRLKNGKSVWFQKLSDFTTKGTFATVLFGEIGIYPEWPSPKQVPWSKILGRLGELMVEEDAATDVELSVKYQNLLADFLDGKRVGSMEENAMDKVPYYDSKGFLHLFPSEFRAWLNLTLGLQMSTARLRSEMKEIGCEIQAWNIKNKEGEWDGDKSYDAKVPKHIYDPRSQKKPEPATCQDASIFMDSQAATELPENVFDIERLKKEKAQNTEPDEREDADER